MFQLPKIIYIIEKCLGLFLGQTLLPHYPSVKILPFFFKFLDKSSTIETMIQVNRVTDVVARSNIVELCNPFCTFTGVRWQKCLSLCPCFVRHVPDVCGKWSYHLFYFLCCSYHHIQIYKPCSHANISVILLVSMHTLQCLQYQSVT